MCIMTMYPHIVESYEKYDDANPFQPITLDLALPASKTEMDAGKLSAVVTYKTRYFDKNGKIMTISFELGDYITVNAIIGVLTYR